MAEEIGKQIGKMFRNLRDKTTETVARQQAAFVRGKIAGTTVKDAAGHVIVDAGHVIDDAAIARAERTGKLPQLVVSAGTAQVQDLKEKAGDYISHTQEGQEARALDTAEDYARARAYVGWVASTDITDVRGNVVIPQGKEIQEEDVRIAREGGLLSALMSAAR